jgi:hypothetical protein
MLTQAFFSAAEGIPEAQRAPVVKAALAAIRDQLKEDREKTKVAKAKAKVKAGKTSTAGRPKITGPAPKEQSAVASKGKTSTAKPGRKASPEPTPEAAPEKDAV